MRTKSIMVALLLVAGGLAATAAVTPANAAAANAVVGIASTPSGAGYWVATADGRVLTYGDAPFKGSMIGQGLNQPIVGMTPTASGQGYWLVAGDGGIFSFGDAAFYGSTGAKVLNQPIVGMASTAAGKGYWLVAADGGIFSYGDAAFFGSMGAQRLNQPVVGMAASPTGKGYWLVASDGGIFNFGDAAFYGSMGAKPLNQPVTAISTAPGGNGYRMVAKDGGIFSFNAPFFGRGVAASPARAIANRPQGDGYWVVYEDGTIQAFGAAQLLTQTNVALANLTLHTVPFVSGLSSPTAMTTRSSDNVIYVTERPGRVRAIRNGVLDPAPVLSISNVDASGERGLLGLAFSADGTKLYVDYVTLNGFIHVVEYTMSTTTAIGPRELLTIDHSTYSNHNGGDLQTGPDGMLYITVGDGGGGGDPFHAAQSLSTRLGKILRINPAPNGSSPYTIPTTNPFVGTPGALPEIWDFGLRNPWRISFDRANGDMWIGDVGQGSWEEVDREAAGSGGHNYGWSIMEGNHPYAGGPLPANYSPPVAEYQHVVVVPPDPDCSISGGVVYRGASIPALVGAYVYADFCSGRIAAVKMVGSLVSESRANFLTVSTPVAFGEDKTGELYVLSLSGSIAKFADG